MTDALEDLRSRCRYALSGHGNRSAADLLANVPVDLGLDRYGAGGAVDVLEREICERLGKPASVFMPSGTMAQQIALRIHADRRHLRTVGFHATCHLELHEEKGYQRLHGLTPVIIGNPREMITVEHLQAVPEPLGAVLFELPLREIGGQLPAWPDLVEQTRFVRDRGAAVHVDGARLWECTPHYEKTPAEIAALFDSVYVSFYKGLGGLGGCCLAGEEDLIAEARTWRGRHGGTLFALWPYAASAVKALQERLPKMPSYHRHAVAIADSLRELDGVDVVPDPPPTCMMHLHLRTTEQHVLDTARRLAETDDLFTWTGSMAAENPAVRILELTVGDATLELKPERVAEIVAQFVG